MSRLVEFFQDSDGQLSMTRLSIFLLSLAYIVQACYLTYTNKVIPDIPVGVAALMGSLYMFNQELVKLHIGKVFNVPAEPTQEGAGR